jgi:hypothetical protein
MRRGAALIGDSLIKGEKVMSATDNKKLMETIFAGAAVGDRTLYVDSLADDVTMTVTG